jgi:hypothetical protein
MQVFSGDRKRASEKILVPIPVGLNGRREESFEAYAHYESKGFVEVEAERVVTNN